MGCVIFDFDGTLVESDKYKYEALHNLFPKQPKLVDMAVKTGINRDHIISIICTELHLDSKSYVKRYSRNVENHILRQKALKGGFKYLRELSKSHNLYIVSRTPQKYLDSVVKKLKISKYFTAIYGVDYKLPILTELIKKHGIKNTLFIGNDTCDMKLLPSLRKIHVRESILFVKRSKR